MQKFLFFDYREIEYADGFTRELNQPVKHPANPLFAADRPWENGNMQLYGSVVKAPGRPFQMWYSVIHKPFRIYLCYAESADGLSWNKPEFDIYLHEGRKTNVVLNADAHGTAVIYDAAEPREDWRYKMVAGLEPSSCVCALHSADGIHWQRVTSPPVICAYPDCPMGLLRDRRGKYVAYHRFQPLTGRRVHRSESWDFRTWTNEPRIVLEPDAGDPPQVQFYGMGAAPYGSYEIGTLWMFHTDVDEMGMGKMNGYQEAELTYARSGYAWHRCAQGKPFIPHGAPGSWEAGNLQCASAPLYLENEIRYYYAASEMRHKIHWELYPQTAGLGMASLRPDGFISLRAGAEPARLLTVAFKPEARQLFLNAVVEIGGSLKAELLDAAGATLEGFSEAQCVPVTGDNLAAPLRWRGAPALPEGQAVRVRLTGKKADLYSIFAGAEQEKSAWWSFKSIRP